MKKLLVSFLVLAMTGGTACDLLFSATPAMAQSMPLMDLDEVINVPNGGKLVSVAVTNENVRNVLRNLASQAGMNLVMDDSVTGTVTVELTKVSVNQALESVSTLADIHIIRQSGNIYLAISRQAAQDKGISRQLSKVIKIYYSNANRVADVLNRSIFGSSAASASGSGSSGGNSTQKVKADSRTNSVIVVGTEREIELVETAITRLDVPRQSKTFYLSHANALDVASMISSSIFNDGTAALTIGAAAGGGSSSGSGSGSGSGGASGGGVTPSTVRVEKEDIQEGTGINNFGGSSSSGSASAGLSSSVTLRGAVKTSDTVSVSPEGPLVIPDTRQNAVTIMGTAEQIAMAESLIPTLDAQLPQVAIEASLVEITSAGVKELSTQWGMSDGRLQTGFNNQALEGTTPTPGLVGNPLQPGTTGLIGLPTVDAGEQNPFARSGISFSTNPLDTSQDHIMQVRTLISNNKAKVLANPTVVATHDSESIISIVNEVVRRVTTQLDSSGFATQTIEIGEAGIVMDILPKIGEDGTVSMRLRPSVTSVRDVRVLAGNIVTLLSKRDMLTQNVRVRDGETLVIGGLISESDINREDKLPLLGDAPLVGAMFRATRRNGSRSELVLMITPHILNKTKVTPTTTASTGLTDYPVQTGMAGGNQ